MRGKRGEGHDKMESRVERKEGTIYTDKKGKSGKTDRQKYGKTNKDGKPINTAYAAASF